jgi:hypothetical protein
VNRTWAHLGIEILISALCVYILLIRTNEYNTRRTEFLSGATATTLLVEFIPKSLQTVEGVTSLFSPDAGVVNVLFHKDGKKLQKRVLDRFDLVKKIEGEGKVLIARRCL